MPNDAPEKVDWEGIKLIATANQQLALQVQQERTQIASLQGTIDNLTQQIAQAREQIGLLSKANEDVRFERDQAQAERDAARQDALEAAQAEIDEVTATMLAEKLKNELTADLFAFLDENKVKVEPAPNAPGIGTDRSWFARLEKGGQAHLFYGDSPRGAIEHAMTHLQVKMPDMT